METSLKVDGTVSDTCVWIKEEPELAEEDETVESTSIENDDPLCEVSSTLHEIDKKEFSNEEVLFDNIVKDIIKKENLGLSLEPIVDFHSDENDPELNFDEVTANVNSVGRTASNEKEPLDSSERVVDMPYQCSECYFSCFQHANLLDHMRIHSADNQHVCTTCNKSFFFKNSHIRHMKIHQHEEVYDALTNSLAATKSADEVKKFTCAACNATFTSRRLLLGHIKRHTFVEQYPCIVCGMRFEQKVQLLRHEKTHADDLQFVCNVCDSRFGDKFALAQHAITHTYDMSYVCRACNRRFWQKERLDEHVKSMHDDSKRFECDVCHNKFARLQDMRRHKRSHACSALLECPLCTFASKSQRVLARHAKAHSVESSNARSYACPICKKKVVGNHQTISHLINHAKE